MVLRKVFSQKLKLLPQFFKVLIINKRNRISRQLAIQVKIILTRTQWLVRCLKTQITLWLRES